MCNKKLVILSGGFDPLHEGHIRLFADAKNKFDIVIVGLNSDSWLTRKKGKPFMTYNTRLSILESIKYIDSVYSFDDSDGTAKDLINKVLYEYANKAVDIYFGNGGDRANSNYPEFNFCKYNNITTVDNLGGVYKANASSSILRDWSAEDSATREWGSWRVLCNYSTNTKIKELIVLPNKSLSWQQHSFRSELWYVQSGSGVVYTSDSPDTASKTYLDKDTVISIPVGTWHKLENNNKTTLHIIEIQYGKKCLETDITRKPFTVRKIL